MDEIICPKCGRPNLSEAEKCWYCQVPLVKSNGEDTQPEKAPDSTADNSVTESIKGRFSGKEKPVEDIPDWLKRIRDLKKADQPVEEVDEWQQQKLFAGLAEEKDKSAKRPELPKRSVRLHGVPDPKPVVPAGQPSLDETSAEENLNEQDESEDIKSNHPNDELPEGFTPLNTGSTEV